MYRLFVCVILVSCLAQSRADTEGHARDFIVSLTPENFNASVTNGSNWFVEFFSPWCGHCRHFKPTWDKFAIEVAPRAPSLVVADVDCSAHFALCRGENVPGFPCLILYQPNKENVFFNGDRTIEAMTDFLISQNITVLSATQAAPSNTRTLVHPNVTQVSEHLTRRRNRLELARGTIIVQPPNVRTHNAISLIRPDQFQVIYFHTPRDRHCWGCTRASPVMQRVARALSTTTLPFVPVTCVPPAPTTDTANSSLTSPLSALSPSPSPSPSPAIITAPTVVNCGDFGIKMYRKLPLIKVCLGHQQCSTYRGPMHLTNILAFVEGVTSTEVPIHPDELMEPAKLLSPMHAWWTRIESVERTSSIMQAAFDEHPSQPHVLAIMVHSRHSPDDAVFYHMVQAAVELLYQGPQGQWSIELRGVDVASSPRPSPPGPVPPSLTAELTHARPPSLIVVVRGTVSTLPLNTLMTPQLLTEQMVQVLAGDSIPAPHIVTQESVAAANAKASAVILELGLFVAVAAGVGMFWWMFASNLSRARERKII